MRPNEKKAGGGRVGWPQSGSREGDTSPNGHWCHLTDKGWRAEQWPNVAGKTPFLTKEIAAASNGADGDGLPVGDEHLAQPSDAQDGTAVLWRT